MISKHKYPKRTTHLEIGIKYGRLTVLLKLDKKRGNSHYYLCKCDCGTFCEVVSNRIGKTTMSCGCLKEECRGSHHDSKERLYRIWCLMYLRCYNANFTRYRDYGGRGITICSEWLRNYENFRSWALTNGYSDDLSIDRIDVNGNYEPSNCRWATMKEQHRNRRGYGKIKYQGISTYKHGYGANVSENGKRVHVAFHKNDIGWLVNKRNEYIMKHNLDYSLQEYKHDYDYLLDDFPSNSISPSF